ncbi:MAG: hypothetical protein V3W44_00675 [Dehalococcoidales bacterium]
MKFSVLLSLLLFHDTGVSESLSLAPEAEDSAEESSVLVAQPAPPHQITTAQHLQRVETQSKQTLMILRALQERVQEEEAEVPQEEITLEVTESPLLLLPFTLELELGDSE